MKALFAACVQSRPRRVVQISAAGARSGASTRFMATKAEADAALEATELDWVILRPGLVLGANAYGATAMLRALAALPVILPLAIPAARVQTVALSDVAMAVLMALEGRLPSRAQIDLVDDETHSLQALVLALRAWQGLPPGRIFLIPDNALKVLCRCGDFLGRFGWRPPLRTTAVQAIEASITGDPSAWLKATRKPLTSLSATLRAMPSSVQEHWFARMWLLKPLVVATLASFWLISGLVGFLHFASAAHVLTERGVGSTFAAVAVGLGSVVDLGLGVAVAIRRSHVAALTGMLVVALFYLGAGSWLSPELWGDPLGPFVKVFPAMALCPVALAIAGDR